MLNSEDNEILCRVDEGTPMGQYLRRFWIPALQSSQLPGPDCDPLELRLLGQDLVAFRDSEGRVGILDALCPHRQAPLFYGRNEESGLRCIYHGWKFDTEGACVDMPSEPPDSDFKHKVRLIGYPVEERAEIVWVYLGPPHLKPELPDIEWAKVAPEQRNLVQYNQECNFVQAIEGDIDSSHIGFLHMDLDALKNPRTQEARYRAADQHPRWIVEPTDYGLMLAARRDAEPDTYYWRINHFYLPWYTTIAGPLDQSRGHGHIWVPVDDEHTQVWCVMWAPNEALPASERYAVLSGPNPHIASLDQATGKLRATKANHFLQDRDRQRNHSFTGIVGVREQDTAVVEGMGAVVDRTREHLGTSDTAIIGMRRQLLNGAKALQRGVEPKAAFDGTLYHRRSWSEVLPRSSADDFHANPRVEELMTPMVP
jgi:phthalate 4,5-dioxygenase oxygenase subunit